MCSKPQKHYIKARKEYEKRLSRYCKLTVKEFKTEDKLIKALGTSYQMLVFVDETGCRISSEELAESISAAEVKGISKTAVVLGCSYEKAGEERADDSIKRLAVSRMSLSADLLCTVMLEQIYRAYKIINGETYHK